MKELFSTFREDEKEQRQLNIEAAKRNVGNQTEAEKKLLLEEGLDDFVKGGKTASPVGDILGVGGGMALGYVAMNHPLKTLSVIGAPNPNSPTFLNELSMEMVTQKGIPGNPIKGVKRISNLVSEIFPDQIQSSGRFFNQLFQKPNIVKQAEEVFSGRLFGVTGGSLPIKNIRQNQLIFGWESAPNAANIPQVQPGGLFKIQPRLVTRTKNQVQRKSVLFQKPVSLDITNGFKSSKKHRNFEEFIEDLLEADRIPAKNIDVAGFRSSAVRQAKYGTELDLYQDYLQGYFNTYDTLDGAMALTINNKAIKLGQSAMGAKSIENLTDINKLFRAYKLNPMSFNSGAFAPGSKTDVKLLKEFADSKSLDDFLVKNTKLQRHHLNIIDDSFALVKGLTGNDLIKMREAMNGIGLIAGNDPANLARVPQQLHQNFVHTQVWGAFGPEWTGRSSKAIRLRKHISSLPFEERIPYLEELKKAEDLTRSIINNAVDEYIDTQIAGFKISLANKKDFQNFMAKLVKRDMNEINPIEFNQPTTIKSTNKPTNKLDTEIESDIFGQGQMQDDL